MVGRQRGAIIEGSGDLEKKAIKIAMGPLQPPWQSAYRRRAPPPPPTFQHIFDSWANSSSIPVVDLDEEEEGIVLQQPRPPQRTNYMPNRRPLLSSLDSPPTTAASWPPPKKPANVWRNSLVKRTQYLSVYKQSKLIRTSTLFQQGHPNRKRTNPNVTSASSQTAKLQIGTRYHPHWATPLQALTTRS